MPASFPIPDLTSAVAFLGVSPLLPSSTSLAASAPQAVLGPTATGALVIGLIWGVLLLWLGARLLRPMVVLAALMAGVLLGVAIARAWMPQVPLWAAAATGGVLGVLAAALLYRPMVATAAGCVGVVAGAVAAWAIIATGGLDAQPQVINHALLPGARQGAGPGEGSSSSAQLLECFTLKGSAGATTSAPGATASAGAAAGGAAGSGLHGSNPSTQGEAASRSAGSVPVGDRILRDLSDLATRAAQRTGEALDATAPAYRTLLYGCILTGGAMGFIAGMLATTLVARILTSMAGAGLTMVAALPLLAAAGYTPLPPGIRPWLLCATSLALLGVAAQTWLTGSAGASAKPAPRARKSAPAKAPREAAA